jgi:hypothetical protein
MYLFCYTFLQKIYKITFEIELVRTKKEYLINVEFLTSSLIKKKALKFFTLKVWPQNLNLLHKLWVPKEH